MRTRVNYPEWIITVASECGGPESGRAQVVFAIIKAVAFRGTTGVDAVVVDDGRAGFFGLLCLQKAKLAAL